MSREEKWQFEKIERIEEVFFNKSLERFYEYGIAGIVRENIQNSLDAVLDKDEPVVVKIKTGEMTKDKIPGITEITDRINNLEGGNEYTNETIEHMKNSINAEKTKYISFEDENTKGLSGAAKGEEGSSRDTWGIYAYKKGVHAIDDDDDHEYTRGGSHGIGKIASNAGSDIHMMFFANCDEKNEQHIGGTIQLIEHEINEQRYRSSGYFSKSIKGKYYPFNNSFDQDIYGKNTRGLKIIIPFLRKGYDNEKSIIKSVCDSFFVSILENNLIVHVNDHILKGYTIKNYILSEELYEQNIEKIKKDFTPLYLNTYTNFEPIDITIKNQVEEFNFQLYFNYDENITTGRVAIIRTIGMKIEDFKVKNNVRKPFNAILVGGQKEDKYLKSLENESHTKIDYDHIKDNELKKQARRFINNLSKEIEKLIDEKIRELNPSDGVLDTKETIYMVENQFKNKLDKSRNQIRINDKQTLIQTGAKNLGEERNSRNENEKEKAKQDKTKRKRKPKKLKEGSNYSQDGKGYDREVYEIRPESVKRIIIKENESIYIDLSDDENFINKNECNIKMVAIDGMGKQCNDSEFNLKKIYKNVKCEYSQNELHTTTNKIIDVPLKSGKIFLNLKWNDDTNKSLKLVYYIEV